MTTTENTVRYIQDKTEWRFDTLEILDEAHQEWIAHVTTTHNTAHGRPEVSFIVIGNGLSYTIFEISTLPKLADWIATQTKREE